MKHGVIRDADLFARWNDLVSRVTAQSRGRTAGAHIRRTPDHPRTFHTRFGPVRIKRLRRRAAEIVDGSLVGNVPFSMYT
jgi:hypothetical protein